MQKCVGAALAVAALGMSSRAFATDCIGVPNRPESLVIDPNMASAEPPPAPRVTWAYASDGDSGECASGPYIYVALSSGVSQEMAGVRVEVTAGSTPAAFDLLGQPYAISDELMWTINDADDVDFVMRLTSLDGAGNPGGSVDARVVERNEGCSLGGGSTNGWLVALSLLALRVRARPARSGRPGKRCGSRV